MARSFSQEPRSDSHKIGETRYRMSHLPSTTAIARTLLLAGILLAVTVLAARTFLPAFAQEAVEQIPYDENGTGPVANFTSMDPEGDAIVWVLSGNDFQDDIDNDGDQDDIFAITDGVLTFKSSPDFENPLDGDEPNSYELTIEARDGPVSETDANSTSTMVVVNVKNLDEPGAVRLSTLAPKVGFVINATVTDPDGETTATLPIDGQENELTVEATWQWARSMTSDGPWTDIVATTTGPVTSNTATYTPNADDVGYYLRATATYFDGESTGDPVEDDPDKVARAVSANMVLDADYRNTPPMFPDQDPDTDGVQPAQTRSVAENSPAGTRIGAPVTATDIGAENRQQVLVYTISGADATPFEIEEGTGQIKVKAGADLDFEDPDDAGDGNDYVVTVTATDPSGLPGTAEVTINVTDVNENPSIAEGDGQAVEIPVDENLPTTTGLTPSFTATDPEDENGELTWSLSGRDSGDFEMATTSNNTSAELVLNFKEMPDYESPADFGSNNVYDVTVNVRDKKGLTDSQAVTVTVRPVPEGHTLTLSPRRPSVGSTVTANFDSLDNIQSGTRVTYSWATSNDPIAGATSNTYRPVVGNVDETVTVTVTYQDGHLNLGGEVTETETSLAILARGANQAPQFLDDNQQVETVRSREIAENAASVTPLGDPISATDDNPIGDTNNLVYTLSGTDARFFTINSGSGLLSTAAMFDYEDPANRDHRYTVRVTATDPSDASKTITVNIDVTNEDEAPVIEGDDPAPFEEGGTGIVARYTATDPEGQPIVWSITGSDSQDGEGNDRFSITSGVLRFVNPPDYESDNSYTIIINANAGTGINIATPKTITVSITNKDEVGAATMSTLQPKEGIALTASLTDPDEGISTPEWEWSRGASRNGPWIHGTGASSTATVDGNDNSRSYTPDDKDVGNYLRAFVVYLDDEDNTATKTAEVISANVVERADYVNGPPMFPDQDPDTEGAQVSTTSRSIAENSPAGTPIGAPVTAVDLDERNRQQVLTYSISGGADASSFEIDRGTGQIKVGTGTDLNFEVKEEYTVEVTATDPSGLATDGEGNPARPSPLEVTIMVTEVPEDPSITEVGPTTISFNEITADEEELTVTRDGVEGDSPVGLTNGSYTLAVYESVDHEDDDDGDDDKNVSWELSGSDADKFGMATTTLTADNNKGQLTLSLKAAPDFEARADSNRDNVYNVRVTVTDSVGVSAHRDVAVTVTNVEETGTVSLSNRQPEVGTPITASLSDIDGGETGITWEWHWATTDQGTPNWDLIRGATSLSYTPVEDDSENFLRATATYTDNAANPQDRPKDSAPNGVSDFAVQDMDDMNEAPEFLDQDSAVQGKQTERRVFENTPAGINVGTDYDIDGDNTNEDVDGDGDEEVTPDDHPVSASDDDTNLTYTLGRTDKDAFDIDDGTGQLMTKAALDYEAKSTYTLTVTATDPALESDTITVTIKVLDVDEEPTTIMRRDLAISGRTNISYPENGTGVVETYSPAGADASGAVLSLGGTDASAFSLSSGGDLTFRSSPNFESPADQGSDNTYNVTISARGGDLSTSRNVTITVENVDEPGTVRVQSLGGEVKVGVEQTAELDEGDEETNVTWQWASGPSDTGPWTAIAGATNNTYTPVEGDVGNHLLVTATYDDPLGSGKQVAAVSLDPVEAESTTGTPGSLELTPTSQLTVDDTVTATLTDPDNPTNQVWLWQRSANGSTNWSNISGATSASYTTTDADAGKYLRATVTYDDDSGAGLTLDASTSNAVKLHRFDGDASGAIERNEVINAINDYLFPADPANPTTTRQDVIDLINLYLFPQE